MEKRNNKISAFQFGIIGFFLSTSIFVGLGINSMFAIAGQDAWIASTISIITGIIPIFILIYIINYRPDKNIFEKNIILFGKWIGIIVNIILCGFVLYLTIILLWSITSFAITMYLIKTPQNFIASIFIFTAIYAVIKGIETISRTSQVLFFLNFIIVFIIVLSLYFYSNIDNLKPFLEKGIIAQFKYNLNFLSYWLTPVIALTVIPKNDVVNPKHLNKYLIGGLMSGLLLMVIVYIIVPAVISAPIAAIYRFPAYYVQRKISIGGAIDNVENFLSIHWYFNALIMIIMGIYFVKTFIKGIFNIKTNRTINIITIIIGILIITLHNYVFRNTVVALEFMKNIYPLYVSLPLLIILIIISFLIFTKKHKKKA